MLVRSKARSARGHGRSMSAEVSERRLELIKTVLELRLGDHDRWGQPDGRAVGVLGQDALRASASHRSRPVPSPGSMSTPAQSPRERTAMTPCPIRASSRARS